MRILVARQDECISKVLATLPMLLDPETRFLFVQYTQVRPIFYPLPRQLSRSWLTWRSVSYVTTKYFTFWKVP